MAESDPTRVLILDDERVITDVICLVLQREGFATRGAYRHQQAIEVACEFRPDIFITGYNNLSEKNGCETAIDVLEFLPQCRIFICSGSAAAADGLEAARQRGYEFDVLPKPVHPQELVRIIRGTKLGPAA